MDIHSVDAQSNYGDGISYSYLLLLTVIVNNGSPRLLIDIHNLIFS